MAGLNEGKERGGISEERRPADTNGGREG